MKRLRSILAHGSALLSLILCIASAALWIQSYRAFNRVDYSTFRTNGNTRVGICHMVYIYHGGIIYMYHRVPNAKRVRFATPPDHLTWRQFPRWKGASAWWFHFGRGTLTGQAAFGGFKEVVSVMIPIWSLFLATAAFPALWLVRRWRTPQNPGRCSNCGYDLRASPDLCPECGTTRQPMPAPSVSSSSTSIL